MAKLFRAIHFRVFLLVLIMGVVSAVVGVYAYFELMPAGIGPRVTITSPPLEFSAGLDKGTFQMGENFTLHFSLKNISNETVTISKPDVLPAPRLPGYSGPPFLSTEVQGVTTCPSGSEVLINFGFIIKAANDTVIYRVVEGMWHEAYDICIEPGGYIRQVFHWARYYYADYGVPLSRGTYKFIGVLRGGVGASWVYQETQPITFVIE